VLEYIRTRTVISTIKLTLSKMIILTGLGMIYLAAISFSTRGGVGRCQHKDFLSLILK